MIDDLPTIYHYTGDGIVTQYFYPAPVYNADELIVRIDSTDVTSYTVDLQTANGKPADLANPVVSAVVTFNTAPPDQSIISIRQNIPADQTVDYSPFERFPADLHEQAIDKQTLVLQRVRDELTYKIGLDPDLPLPTYNVIFPPWEEGAIPQWSENEGILENFQLGDVLDDLQSQITQNANDIDDLEAIAGGDVALNTAHRLNLNNPHGTPTRYVQETVPSAAAGDEWVIPSTGGTYVLLTTGNWVQTNPGNVFGTAPVLPPPVASAIANDSTVPGASVKDALETNNAGIAGSVTVHSDVTSAGSGQIITNTERANITGSVTVHSDVTSAGSGAIITSGERSQLTNANNHANGSVTDHSDVTSAGSGAIITSTERTDLYQDSNWNAEHSEAALGPRRGLVEMADPIDIAASVFTGPLGAQHSVNPLLHYLATGGGGYTYPGSNTYFDWGGLSGFWAVPMTKTLFVWGSLAITTVNNFEYYSLPFPRSFGVNGYRGVSVWFEHTGAGAAYTNPTSAPIITVQTNGIIDLNKLNRLDVEVRKTVAGNNSVGRIRYLAWGEA